MGLQLRRGLDANRSSITPSIGELIYVTDTKTVYVGDGTTAGGVQVGSNTALSITNVGSLGSLAYNSSTGVITYTAPTATDIRSQFTGGTGISITTGTIAVDFTEFDTDDVTEGTTNVYYTDTRARSAVSVSGSLSYNSGTGVISYTTPNTDGITEGSTNLYYTTARANSDFDTRLATKSTSNLTEGTNLYYTDVRARTAISVAGNLSYDNSTGVISYSTPNTDSVTEGSTNLYFTDTRARNAISVSGSLNYNSGTGVISYTTPSTISSLSNHTTDNLSEGSTNLYFTNARARGALSGGTGVTYNSTTGEIAIGQAVGTSSNVTFNDVTVSGNLIVNGTTTTVNSTTITVDDKNLELGSVNSPTDITADGGGITLKGTTDKTFNWVDATDAWTSSEHLALAAGKQILLNGSTSGTITLQPTSTAGTTTITLPATTGTVVTTGDNGTVTNTMLAGSIANNKLTNSSITVNGTAIALGASGTVTANTTNALTAGTGLQLNSGTTFDGSAAKTISIDSTVATTSSKLSAFAATTSAELAGVISDETGSGALVFATSPALTTPSLSGETFSTNAAVTAGTNAQGQGALTSDYNVITTAASNPSGVTLPTATTGRRIVIVNRGSNSVNVYPASGATIDGLSANASISLAANAMMIFNASSTTQWYSSYNLATGASGGVTSVSQTFTGGLISVSGSPITDSGTLALTVAGTSGGIPYFSSASTWASSAALTASALVIGGGAGAAPSTTTTGTGVLTALGVAVGTAGAFVVNGGALGTPLSGTLTNATGLPLTTGVTGTLPIANGGTGATTAPAANANLTGFTTTATAGGTTTLTNASSYYQVFTGSSNQTVQLPATSTLAQGWSFHIVNNSTGTLTVQTSTAVSLGTIPPGVTAMPTALTTSGNTATDWEFGYTDFSTLTGTGSNVLATGPSITNATLTTPTLSGTVTGSDGLLTRVILLDTAWDYFDSNTTSALDYVNGSVQRWAPSGTVSLTVTNWPASGALGELLVEGINLGAATITWPTVNWVTVTGATTTTFSSNGVTLQSSGTDWFILWTRDGGTTVYGKFVR